MRELGVMNQVKNSNETKFVEVYQNYWQPLFNSGYKRLKRKEVVEGIVQEVFVELWQKRSDLEIRRSMEAYLFTMMKYKVINYIRFLVVKDKYIHFVETNSKQLGSEVEEKLLFGELEKAFDEEVKKLPLQSRNVYQLRYYSGLKYSEIAEKLTISVSTVEKHMIKANKILRTNLRGFSN